MKWSEAKWSEVKWSEVKWSEVKWSEVKWSEVKRNETKRNETKRKETKRNEMKWNEMKWNLADISILMYSLFSCHSLCNQKNSKHSQGWEIGLTKPNVLCWPTWTFNASGTIINYVRVTNTLFSTICRWRFCACPSSVMFTRSTCHCTRTPARPVWPVSMD